MNATPTEKIVATLNELLTSDPTAVRDLIDHAEVVNQTTAARPDLFVSGKKDKPKLSVLGLLNGALHTAGYARVAKMVAEDGQVVGFQIYVPPAIPETVTPADPAAV